MESKGFLKELEAGKNPFKVGSPTYVFMDLCNLDFVTGISSNVLVSDLEKRGIKFGNGASWCRDDSVLGKYFKIDRPKSKGKITSICLVGWNKRIFDPGIGKAVYAYYAGKPCALCGSYKDVEIDHINGRKDKLIDINDPKNFQPLCKTHNDEKRGHCIICKRTGKRYDATARGYLHGFTSGDVNYKGTCNGCLMERCLSFYKDISSNFKVPK